MTSNASTEISESHIERTKKLIEKRDGYVKTIFDEVREKLVAFTDSKDYVSFMHEKIKKIANNFNEDSIMYIAKKDLSMKDELIKVFGKNIKVEVDEDITIGGFIVENKDLHLVVDETLDFALNSQKEWFNKNSGLIIK